jgi:hypothetical protein
MSSSPRLRGPDGQPTASLGAALALTAFPRLYGQFWSHGIVDQPTKEVTRLRNARITDCGF